jgi:adenosylcobinamide-phosphate synthase
MNLSNSAILVLVLAAIVDLLIGDPKRWLHPVQVMGWIIENLTRWILNRWQQQKQRRFAGIILGISLISSTAIASWIIIEIATKIHFGLGIVIQTILLASCFALRSLRQATEDVLDALKQGNIEAGRSQLSQYVGRDTENLSESEIFRALLETVAENTPDGITAPLFYAILGCLIPGLGLIPFAMAYKMASTLDSMIGYQKEPYLDIGWFSAKFEDLLTWLPSRLTVLTLALLSGKPREVLAVCENDAPQDPSPNSGWSEAAYAAILGVELGGINYYGGEIREKPRLGKSIYPISAELIEEALKLARLCFLSWLGFGIIFLLRID